MLRTSEKPELGLLPGSIFGPLVRVHQEARSNSCFLLNTSTELIKRHHLHTELIFLVPCIQEGDRLEA